jgi:hypothetical protein
MYKIIGADQKEYGPVTIDQIRQWIRDGRVNAQTQARVEPGGQWQPLSAFPEFADAFGTGMPGVPGAAPAPAPPTPFPVGGGSREAALSAVKGPAIALIVMASLGIAFFLFSAAGNFRGGAMMNQPPPANLPPEWQHFYESMKKMGGPLSGVIDLFFAAMNGLVLYGAIKMMRLESRTLTMTTCIIAMLPFTTFCCCILGLPFGIWGLVVLNKPDVKSNFT